MTRTGHMPPEPPDYWVTGLDQIEDHLSKLKTWDVREICRSPGRRPVWACTRGPKKQIERTSNLSAALGGHCPEAFWGKGISHQCLMIVACVHGSENEGAGAAVHLMHILEDGPDLLGREWPQIRENTEGMRLVIVPCANPDGRARVTPASMIGMPTDDFSYWGIGEWKSGENIGYPACKRYQPLDLDDASFPGGYPNDDGYNIMHDATPGDIRTAEAQAIIDLALDEAPDCIVNVHSHEMGPNILGCPIRLPGYAERQKAMSERVVQIQEEHGLRPVPYRYSSGYNLNSALHFACGALAVTFEGPQGLADDPYTYQEILDCHLTALQGVLAYGAEEGFRPPRKPRR